MVHVPPRLYTNTIWHAARHLQAVWRSFLLSGFTVCALLYPSLYITMAYSYKNTAYHSTELQACLLFNTPHSYLLLPTYLLYLLKAGGGGGGQVLTEEEAFWAGLE